MVDQTIWKLDLQAGNSDAVLKSFENSLNVAKDRINQVVAAGQNFEKLSSFQTKAAEAAKKLEVAQASAALALKKAQDAASNGKASAEQLALMQAKAGLAAQKVETAENSLGSAMAKVKGESDRLSSAMQEETRSTDSFANAINAIKGVLSTVASHAKAAFSGIADATSHVKSAFSSVAELAGSAGSSIVNGFKNAATGIRDFVGNFRMASSEVDTFKEKASTIHISILSSLRSAGAGFLDLASKISNVTTGIQNIIQWSISLGTALFKPIVASEQLGIAFTTLMGGSKKAAEDLIKTLNHFADVTPFEPQPVQEYAAQLIGMGIDAKQTIPIMTSLGDALFGIGHGTEAEMASVVDIIGKIRVAGKATWGDISQLQTHGIDALDAMSRATGKTKDALRDMAGKGGIPAKEAIDALTKGIEMNPLYQGGMAKQAQSLSGVLSTLTGYLKEALNTFLGLKDGMVITGSILDQLKTGFSILGTMVSNPIFQDFAEKTGKKIADVLTSVEKTTGRVITGFKDLAKSLDQASGKAFVSDLAYMGRQLSYVFGTIQSLGGNVLNAFRGHLTGASGTLSGVFASALRIAGNGLHGVGDELHHLMSFLGSINVNPLVDGFFKAGNSAAKFIANIDPIPVRLFFSSIEYLELQLKRTAGIVEGTVLYLFKQLASSFDFVTGKTTAFHKSFEIVNGVFVKTRSPLQLLIGEGFFRLGAIITKVAEDVHRFSDTIDNKLKTAFEGAKEALHLPVFQKMEDVLGRLGRSALDLGGSILSLWMIFSPIGALFKEIGGSGLTFSGVLSSIGDIIDNYVTPAINGLKNFIHDMGPTLKPIGAQLLGMFMGVGKWLTDNGPTITSIGGKIFSGIGDIIKQVSPAISKDLLPAIGRFGEKIGGLVSGFLTWLDKSGGVEKGMGFLGTAINGVIGIVTWLVNALSSPQFASFMTDMKNMGMSAIQFGVDIYTRVKPLVENFMHWWGVAWPGIQLLLEGVWNGIKGTIQIAWALISGYIKIGLDIMSGNWGKAWQDMKDMLGGIWEGIKTYLSGAINVVKGWFAIGWYALKDIIGKPFTDAWAYIQGVFNNIQGVINSITGQKIQPDTSQIMTGPHHFASGVENFGGGLAFVHAKEMLVNLPPGTSVWNPAKTAAFMQQPMRLPTPSFSQATQGFASNSGGNDQAIGLLTSIAADLHTLVQQGGKGGITFNNTMQSNSPHAGALASAVNSILGHTFESTQRGAG